MNKRFLQWGALLGCLSVALGAFGAHGLKKMLAAEDVAVFETGVRYQFYHVFAILAAGLLAKWFHPARCRWAAVLFFTGIVLFSGSLYLMSFAKARHWEGLASLGWITPIGGLFLMAGWIVLFTAFTKESSSSGKGE